MPESRERVLIVDDEAAVLEVCMRVLRRRGFEVTGANNGRRALEHFAQESFDLILSDIKMPDLDGLELLRQVKKSHPDTPVVLITGYGSMETAMEAVRFGAGGFLLKPFHAPELVHAVEEAMAKSRLWRENVRLQALVPLLEASRSLMGQVEMADLARLIVRLATEVLPADQAWLLDQASQPAPSELAYAGPKRQPDIESASRLARAARGTGTDVASANATLLRHLGLSDAFVVALGGDEPASELLVFGRQEGHEPFGEGDMEALGIFAGQAATALQNAHLFQQTRNYAENLEEMVQVRTRELVESEAQVRQLYETSRQLHISLDLDLVVENMLALAIAASSAALGRMQTISPDGETHRVQQGEFWDAEEAEEAFSAHVLDQIAVSRKVIAIGSVTKGDASVSGATGSALALPLTQDGDLQAILVLRHPEPNRFSVEHRDLLIPICDRAAALIANARVFRQTTERLAQAYEELEERAEQLEMTTQQLVRADRLAIIGQLAAGISHEMGNIIAPLQVYADLLQSAQPGAPDHANYVEQIQRITERARTILRQFTDFARKDTLRSVAVDVRTVLDQSISLMRYSLNRKGIMLEMDLPASSLLVNMDPGQLEQVFVNVIVNAIDAMPGGGSLHVRIAAHRRADLTSTGGYVEIRFRDTGVGIEPENLARVFEPFFTTKDVGKGTGLGLFICYGIIERHHGSIDIESQPGKGTTMIIRLPRSGDRTLGQSSRESGGEEAENA